MLRNFWKIALTLGGLSLLTLGAQAQFSSYGSYGYPGANSVNRGGYLLPNTGYGTGYYGSPYSLYGGAAFYSGGAPYLSIGVNQGFYNPFTYGGAAPYVATPYVAVPPVVVNPNAEVAAAPAAANVTANPCVQALREPSNRVRLTWMGDLTNVQRITFQLLDSQKRTLREAVVTQRPASVRMLKPIRAQFYRVLVESSDGSTRISSGSF